MKETPILFSGEMVRAILSGQKTQTRRIVNPQPILEGIESFGESWKWKHGKDWFSGVTKEQLVGKTGLLHPSRSKFGQVGNRLWVKETFFDARPFKHEPLFAAVDAGIIYRADYDYREGQREPSVIGLHHWKPSIFMPRIASRITLEITGLRVERLNDISEEDAAAEGVTIGEVETGVEHNGIKEYVPECPSDAYIRLWESINGKGSWAKNEFVWVIEFKRL